MLGFEATGFLVGFDFGFDALLRFDIFLLFTPLLFGFFDLLFLLELFLDVLGFFGGLLPYLLVALFVNLVLFAFASTLGG